jgi:hypothetical protein
MLAQKTITPRTSFSIRDVSYATTNNNVLALLIIAELVGYLVTKRDKPVPTPLHARDPVLQWECVQTIRSLCRASRTSTSGPADTAILALGFRGDNTFCRCSADAQVFAVAG